jgi:hypothetical protein
VRHGWNSSSAVHELLHVVECGPQRSGWQHTVLVQSAASSHGCVMPLEQLPVNEVHEPPSGPPTQHCSVDVLHAVLPHVTIMGVLGAPPSGTDVTGPPPLEPAPPSPRAPPSPPEPLAPCPPLLAPPSASASSPPPELPPPPPPLLLAPLLLAGWPPPPSPAAITLPLVPPEHCVSASGAADASTVTQARKARVVLITSLLFRSLRSIATGEPAKTVAQRFCRQPPQNRICRARQSG